MREYKYNWQQQHKLFQADAQLRGQQTAGPSTSAHRAGLSVPWTSSSHPNKSSPEERPVNITFKQKHRPVDDSPSHPLQARPGAQVACSTHFVQYVIADVRAKLSHKNVDPASLNALKLDCCLFGLWKLSCPAFSLWAFRERENKHKDTSKFEPQFSITFFYNNPCIFWLFTPHWLTLSHLCLHSLSLYIIQPYIHKRT